MDHKIDFPRALLQDRNLRVTAIRVAILNAMKNYGTAMPSILFQRQFKNTDRVTLYRTLQTLMVNGIIHKAFSNENETYYALCGADCNALEHSHNHVHFKCTKCAIVTCEYLEESVSISLPRFKIDKTTINIEGICETCLS